MSTGTLPEREVQAQFDRIADIYDSMNSVMTAGLHSGWSRRAAELACVNQGDTVLDVATGTGDLAFELAGRVGKQGRVTACDFSTKMLELARDKADQHGVEINFDEANALNLPYKDNSFTAATVGFGVRNFADLNKGVAELVRVVKPGGKVVILEITTPQRPPLSWFFRLWFDLAVPVLGRLAGDRDAYTYLPNSVRRFPSPAGLAELMCISGLRDIRYVLTAGGIIAIHVGIVE